MKRRSRKNWGIDKLELPFFCDPEIMTAGN